MHDPNLALSYLYTLSSETQMAPVHHSCLHTQPRTNTMVDEVV